MILDEIIKNKEEEVKNLTIPSFERVKSPRSFKEVLERSDKIKLIAEIKKQSPSAGIIQEGFNPEELAKTYEACGASAISVLTDKKYFGGSLEDLKAARAACSLPILRKDFIIDEKQIYEAKLYGADAVLLIAKVLGHKKLQGFLTVTKNLHLDALVETHNSKEVELTLETDAEIIGINNRDLQTFQVNFKNTLSLIEKYPELKGKILVSESGIKHAKQVQQLHQAGISGILVGESLLKANNISKKVTELIG